MRFKKLILSILFTLVVPQMVFANVDQCLILFKYDILANRSLFGRPLPLEYSPDLSDNDWARLFTAQYRDSLRYDYPRNTVKPDFKFANRGMIQDMANGAMITGDEHYPLDVVLSNLGLKGHLPEISKSTKILSVGEGRSNLVPNLAKHGYQAKGTDIWYDAVNKEAAEFLEAAAENYIYVQENRALLDTADATKLPYTTESMDLVLSHEVINNLSPENAELTVQEMIRVTAKGGQTRIAFNSIVKFDSLIRRLKSVPWLKVSTSENTVSWKNHHRTLTVTSTILVIEKSESTPKI